MIHSEVQSRGSWQARRWACLVGANYYQSDAIGNLRYCVSDAKALFDLLVSEPEYGYEQDQTCLLVSADQVDMHATRLGILSHLTELAVQTHDEDLLLFYFAGHGEIIDNKAYLIPSDADGRLLLDSSISLERVKEIVQTARAKAKVIILDACHAGIKLRNRSTPHNNSLFIRSVFKEAQGIAILASSSQDELSWEDADKQHGVFTYYLLEGLAGAANAQPDQFLTLNEIANYVTKQVKNWALLHQAIQRPTLEFQGSGEIVLLTTGDRFSESPSKHSIISLDTERPNPIGREFPAPIKKWQDLYGRQLELSRIKGVLNATTDKVITIKGERGIGKTSVLNMVKMILREEQLPDRHFLYASIEPSSVSSCADFALEMWHGLQNSLSEAGKDLSSKILAPFTYDTFSRFVAKLRLLYTFQPGATFVIFLDEFDKIFKACDDLEQKRIIGLMRHIVEATEIPLVFIISILQELPSFYGSVFPADRVILHPFERATSDQMIKDLLRGYATISNAELAWLYDASGGHPYFIKLLLTKLFEAYTLKEENQSVSVEMLQVAAKLAERSTRADAVLGDIYTTYLNNDDERFILLWLTNHPDGVLTPREVVEAGSQMVSVIEELTRRDYLVRGADGSYRLRISFQRDWLRNWPKFKAELERLKSPGQFDKLPSLIVQDGICIDLTTQRIYMNGIELQNMPTDLEYRALVFLAEHSGQIVGKHEFADHIWGAEDEANHYEGDEQRISQLIHRLRKLLDDQRRPYIYLETLRNRGFCLQKAIFVRTAPSS